MSEKNKSTPEKTRIAIRVGNVHIEAEGTLDTVKSLMGNKTNAFEMVQELQKTIAKAPSAEAVSPAPEVEGEAVPPQLGKPTSCTDALSTLFGTDWGKEPRNLAEIMGILQLNGLYYRKSAVAKILTDLMKKKEVRRLGSRGSFKYVSTTP